MGDTVPTTALDMTEQAEIGAEIGGVLAGGLPDGWAKATLRWSDLVSSGSMAGLAVLDADGRSLTAAGVPRGIDDLCRRLRAGMHDETHGTWYTLTYTLVPERYSVDYDYDHEPDAPSFTPEHYARDLKYFPRAEEHVPDWLREKLDGIPDVYGAVYLRQTEDDPTPSRAEFVDALTGAGWEIGPSDRFRGEIAFSTGWARLSTLSDPWLVRFAGQVDPGRWEELHALLTGFGWNVGMSCYEPRGGELVREFPRPRESGS
ncbi:hypothetical protein ACFZAG_19810 [Streptomyces sp. NPDC012403]|uniref:hypothetical protein n=1 Tax=Streptomyces sp. NPDC012403 TaxID=3364831 RepID=UPI0036E07345